MSNVSGEDFSGKFVIKPWGGEYLCFENKNVAVWCLHIRAGHETSFHCHPRKSTGLLLLGGQVHLDLIRSSYVLSPCSKLNIFPRRFHKTQAVLDSILFEVETPVDKRDLVRLTDANGRSGNEYENVSSNTGAGTTFFDDTSLGRSVTMGDCIVTHTNVSNFDELDDLGSGVVVFLSGGVVTNQGDVIVAEGEFLDQGVLEIYRQHFAVLPNSQIFRINLSEQ